MTEDQRLGWREGRDTIHGWILSGRYGAGDKLPRDADIAGDLDCARSTVLRAMQDLSDAGVVDRRRRGGTRVRPDPVVRATLDIPITRKEIEGNGGRYGYRLVRRARALPPAPVLAAVGWDTPREMLRVEALHLSDDTPHMFEDRWISLEAAPEVLSVDLAVQNANEWLVLNKPYSRFEVRFHAIAADPRLAGLMQVAEGAPMLAIERTTWIAEQPITTVKSVARPGFQLLSRS